MTLIQFQFEADFPEFTNSDHFAMNLMKVVRRSLGSSYSNAAVREIRNLEVKVDDRILEPKS